MHPFLPAALAAATLASDAPPPGAVERLTTATVIPRFQAVEDAAVAQRAAWTSFCAKRAGADPAPLLKAYDALADAWARIEFIRMGPAEAELREERFNYWLDRENATGRALTAMLGSTDPLTSERLKAGSVAGQGMPALERLLYGKDALALLRAPDAGGERRCAVGQAVSASLAALAGEMARGWAAPDGAAAAIAADKGWGVAFANSQEASRVMLTNLVGGLEVLKDSKLALAFHDEANPGAPVLAENARSGRTLRDIMINFDEVRAAIDLYMTPATPEQKRTVAAAFDATRARLDAVVRATQATPPHSEERQAALKAALASFVDLQQVALVTVPAGAGVALGFNSLDGD